jgi:hypothetical protein
MRPVALARKNWIHMGSPEAGPNVQRFSRRLKRQLRLVEHPLDLDGDRILWKVLDNTIEQATEGNTDSSAPHTQLLERRMPFQFEQDEEWQYPP